jgi:hypothetical protein
MAPQFGVASSDQVLGDFGLWLQLGQPRLLVHAGHLLAGGQTLAHDRDQLAVGGRLMLQRPGRHQVQNRPASRSGS